jgi:phosphate:Na+ symporter
MESLLENDSAKVELVLKNEERINHLQESVTQYLVEISRQNLDSDQSLKIPALINSINNFERVGDHCEDIIELAQRKIDHNIHFSGKGLGELRMLYQEVLTMLDECYNAFAKEDVELALQAVAREDRIDAMSDELKEKHIKRLEEGTCKVEAGIVFLEVVNHLERAADHIHNISLLIVDDVKRKTVPVV